MNRSYKLDKKTKDLITYITNKHQVSTVTSLIKLCYLSDLVSYKETGRQISSFKYVRWHYGPYDQAINAFLYDLVEQGTVLATVDYTQDNQEYVKYSVSSDYEINLNDKELASIDSVLDSLRGFGPKALTEVAYKTKPMKKFGATLGGKEHMGEPLDLSAA